MSSPPLWDARPELRLMTVTKKLLSFMALAHALTLLASAPALAQYEGWTIPANAKTEKSPYASAAADAAKKGKAIFQAKCQRCHGAEGKGNGPEADKNSPPANLTEIKTAETRTACCFTRCGTVMRRSPARRAKSRRSRCSCRRKTSGVRLNT
jgi:mono/diheme cytochrome c family protein